MLNVLDEFTHECLAIRVARKLKAIDVIDVLSDLFILRRVPAHIRSDNGPESQCSGRCHELIASLGGAAAVVCSRTRAAALPTDRPICNARVPQAIGQSFDWLVPAEAEVLGAGVADRPAAFPLAELEQRRLMFSAATSDAALKRLTTQEKRVPCGK